MYNTFCNVKFATVFLMAWVSLGNVPLAVAAPNLSDYEMVFNDEFNGTSLDTDKWATSPIWGPFVETNNEQQYYLDKAGLDADHPVDPFLFDGQTLTIRATEVGEDTVPSQPAEGDDVWSLYPEYTYNSDYTPSDRSHFSGLISSVNSFTFTHGYVEARAKTVAGRGLWPAFWLLTNKYVEDAPEIDIMEALGQNPDEVHHTMHYFDTANNWALISTPTYTTNGSDFTEEFHTFGMMWSPEAVAWYVDGVEVKRITSSEYKIPTQAMYVIANLAVGGSWPGSPDSTTPLPADYQVDYIRVYQRTPPEVITPETLASDYQLMFSDEFSGNTLDSSKWDTSYLWGPHFRINNEEQVYVDVFDTHSTYGNSPFDVSNGTLKISAESVVQSELPVQPAETDDYWNNHPERQYNSEYNNEWIPGYTSGLITSYDSFKFVHGYVEYRAKLPKGDGLWPALWLLNGYYVGSQPEIDIMELQGEVPDTVHQSYHYFEPNGNPVSSATTHQLPTGDFSEGFHTFGVKWHPGEIVWYVDGSPVRTLQGPEVSLQLMYLLANLAVGGNFVGAVGDEFPAVMEIDYVRAYQLRETRVVAPPPSNTMLTVGETDTGEYGWVYGTDENKDELIRTFVSSNVDLTLAVTGFDIDVSTEISVHVNDVFVGHLLSGPNNALTDVTTLSIPASIQIAGENQIRFEQLNSGWRWGVTDLLLSESVVAPPPTNTQLTLGEADAGEYGWVYGTAENRDELIRTFDSTGVDLTLSVTGFDIDVPTEISVYVNDVFIGHLLVGEDNALTDVTTLSIPANMQIAGENQIRFEQLNSGWRWGVTDLLLSESVVAPPPTNTQLPVGEADTGEYGWVYGTAENRDELIRTFDSTGVDLTLSVTGFDIDVPTEISVYVNDVFTGYLLVGEDNALTDVTTLSIPASMQIAGENQIRFEQLNSGWRWGVTDLLLSESVAANTELVVGEADTGEYGWAYGTAENKDQLIRTFTSTGVDLTLSVTGFDIDVPTEISVYVNDVIIGYLLVGEDNALTDVTTLYIPASMQIAGENQIRFEQLISGFRWGVTDLLLSEATAASTELTVGETDTGEYGWAYGTAENKDELIRTFASTGDDLSLSVTGFDIDVPTEISVYVNDVIIGHLLVGEDNALTDVTTLSIPASLQIAGENQIRFEQLISGFRWGVTNILLEQ